MACEMLRLRAQCAYVGVSHGLECVVPRGGCFLRVLCAARPIPQHRPVLFGVVQRDQPRLRPRASLQLRGLTFLDSNTILIGGQANTNAGRLYTIDVIRGAGNHITNFSGTATSLAGPVQALGTSTTGA